jgi:hypothetical protein
LEVEQASDNQHHLAVAWTLRGLASEQGLAPVARDAAVLALRAWLGHPGARVARRAIDERGAAHDLDALLFEHGAPVVVVSARISASQPADSRQALLKALTEPVATAGLELRGACRLSRADILARYSDVPGRAELLSELLASGRAEGDTSAAKWIEEVTAILDGSPTSETTAFVEGAVLPVRRLVITAKPTELPRSAQLRLNSTVLDDYLRVVVDLQCPGPKYPPEVSTLLREKYQLTPRQYAEIARAVAHDRRLRRDLAHEADHRCEELGRLRALMPAERVVVLHEAVVCGPGVNPATDKAKRDLAKIYRRFNVDPSWYRPLRRMAEEQPATARAIEAIDKRCPSPEGTR